MNLFIALVILIYLVVAEMRPPSEIDDWRQVFFSTMFITAMVPAMALLQWLILKRRAARSSFDESAVDQVLRRTTACHAAVWMAASLLIVGSTGWQDLIRQYWNLDRWPLVDDLVLVAPILFSLVASWAVFYDVQRLFVDSSESQPPHRIADWLTDARRWAYVVVRVRVYLLLLLVPAIAVLLFNDLNSLHLSSQWMGICYAFAFATLIFGFPFLLTGLWRLKPIEDIELRESLLQFCRAQKLGVFDVKVWNTNNQISNAMVAGFVPGCRIIVITDGLLKNFRENELRAILRHEAAHIKLLHLPIRLFFVLLPLVAMAIVEQSGVDASAQLTSALLPLAPVDWAPAWFGPAFVYCAYALFAVSWISRKMELEADEFSVRAQTVACVNDPSLDTRQNATDMLDALIRVATYSPNRLDRRTLLHPSLTHRVERLVQLRDRPQSPPPRLSQAVLHGTFFTLTFLVAFMAVAIWLQRA